MLQPGTTAATPWHKPADGVSGVYPSQGLVLNSQHPANPVTCRRVSYARTSELIMNGIMRGIPTPYPTLMKGDITHNVLVERVTCESLPEHMDPTLDLQCRVLVGRCPTPATVCTFLSSRGQGRVEGYRTIHEAQHRVEGCLHYKWRCVCVCVLSDDLRCTGRCTNNSEKILSHAGGGIQRGVAHLQHGIGHQWTQMQLLCDTYAGAVELSHMIRIHSVRVLAS
jgi:hypothetical protein